MSGFKYTVALDTASLSGRAKSAARAGALAAAEAVRQRASGLAPRRSGALAGSARVEAAQGTAARVSFGVPYARIQHESGHFRHPGGGQARFLAEALRAPEAAEALRRGFAAAFSR